MSWIEALEIGMKLEVSLVEESGARTTQIQSQLANMSLQIKDTKKGKDINEYVLCTGCKIEGHHKDSFPAFSVLPCFECAKSIEFTRDAMV